MTASRFTLELTEAESALVSKIELDPLKLSGPEHVKINGERVWNLLRSLHSRHAIPEHRSEWFLDPQSNTGGRGSSRRDMFERNGVSGKDIVLHPHFLPHFRYFIHGPNLPTAVIEAFVRDVEMRRPVTSSDVAPLGKLAPAAGAIGRLEPQRRGE